MPVKYIKLCGFNMSKSEKKMERMLNLPGTVNLLQIMQNKTLGNLYIYKIYLSLTNNCAKTNQTPCRLL